MFSDELPNKKTVYKQPKKCGCSLCIRNEECQGQLNQLDELKRKYWCDIYNTLLNVEQDLNYCKAIIDGSWPTADEQIKIAREQKVRLREHTL